MCRFSIAVLTAMLTLLGEGMPVQAQTYGKAPVPGEIGPDVPDNVDYVQKLGNTVPTDIVLYDHDSKPVKLGDLINGKPTILVLHYNRCPKLCNEVIHGLLDALNDCRKSDPSFIAGGPFRVVLVSVDPREAPTAARKNREIFHQQYDRRDPNTPGVWFLTASHGQGTDVRAADHVIHQLTNSVGFQYTLRFRNKTFDYSESEGWKTKDGQTLPSEPRTYDYGHAPGLVVLTPEGKVSKYLLRLNPTARDLRMAVVDASGGQIGRSVSDKIAQYCFVYDDVKGHYRFTLRWMAVAFSPFYLLVMYIAFRTWRQMRAENATNHATGNEPKSPAAVWNRDETNTTRNEI